MPKPRRAQLDPGVVYHRGAWAASTAYALNDVVTQGGIDYRATVAHTSGASFDSANWLAQGGSSGGGTPTAYAAKIRTNAVTAVPSGIFTAITLSLELIDTANIFAAGTDTFFTIPTGGAGVYSIGGLLGFAGNATGRRMAVIAVNGVNFAFGSVGAVNSDTAYAAVTALASLAVGDTVKLLAYQDSGGTINTTTMSSTQSHAQLWLHRVGT